MAHRVEAANDRWLFLTACGLNHIFSHWELLNFMENRALTHNSVLDRLTAPVDLKFDVFYHMNNARMCFSPTLDIPI